LKLLGIVLVTAACHAQAQMYKCTNERGVVQYTDKPGAGCKEVAIRPSPPISGSLQAPSEDLARQEAEFRKRQLDRDTSVTQERQALAQRCTQMRREQSLLMTSRRLVRMNEKGEATYVEDAARDQRLADIQRELGRCP
jgi:response regulator RpfG family c-di-GMP phosphodiesterase